MDERLTVKSAGLGLRTACLATIAGVIAPVLLLLTAFLLEPFQPRFDPIRRTISTLVWGTYGWLVTLSFILFGLLFVVFTLTLYLAMDRGKARTVAFVCLLLIGVGFLVLGILPTQPPGTPATTTAVIHRVASLVMSFIFPVVCCLLAASFRASMAWRRFATYTLVTGVLTAVLSIIAILVFTRVIPPERFWHGLHERTLLIIGLAWVETIAIHLLRSCLRDRRKLQGKCELLSAV
ncbi:MAG: DUF998 domain-containing protein [Chloroflexi bacterium]|nr:DUF998 domain-containing protein [Chloroflexota bacterium]